MRKCTSYDGPVCVCRLGVVIGTLHSAPEARGGRGRGEKSREEQPAVSRLDPKRNIGIGVRT